MNYGYGMSPFMGYYLRQSENSNTELYDFPPHPPSPLAALSHNIWGALPQQMDRDVLFRPSGTF